MIRNDGALAIRVRGGVFADTDYEAVLRPNGQFAVLVAAQL